jgi:succinate dehydrogenase/fumarate reductase flavoprotein subunit
MVMDIKAILPEMSAKDTHDLAACNEARSMAICAEMFYRASLGRKESRGWFIRANYPEIDKKNWLRWVTAKQEAEKMVLSTEPIHINK